MGQVDFMLFSLGKFHYISQRRHTFHQINDFQEIIYSTGSETVTENRLLYYYFLFNVEQ